MQVLDPLEIFVHLRDLIVVALGNGQSLDGPLAEDVNVWRSAKWRVNLAEEVAQVWRRRQVWRRKWRPGPLGVGRRRALLLEVGFWLLLKVEGGFWLLALRRGKGLINLHG